MIALKTIASNIRRAAFITSSYDILVKKIPYFGYIAFYEDGKKSESRESFSVAYILSIA